MRKTSGMIFSDLLSDRQAYAILVCGRMEMESYDSHAEMNTLVGSDAVKK